MTRRKPKPVSVLVPTVPSELAVSHALAESIRGAGALAGHARAASTARMYKHAWGAFVAWCKARRVAWLPADPAHVALYAADCGEGRAGTHRPQSIDVYLAAIRAHHVAAGHASPCDHPAVAETMRALRRKHGVRPQKKTPAVVAVLRRLIDATHGESATSPYVLARDRAMLLVGFAGALRRSELVALDWRDIAPRDGGLLVTIRRSKTDQAGAGRTVHVHAGTAPLDPVAALDAWRGVLGDLGYDRRGPGGDESGAVFVSLSSSSWLCRLTPGAVAIRVKRYADLAGLDPADYAAHSLRSGFATSAARAGKSLDKIRAQTRHASLDMLSEYLADDVPWDDDAGKGLL